jgi:acetate kinase
VVMCGMDKKYLIINIGSASKKYALFEGEKELFGMHLEAGMDNYIGSYAIAGESKDIPVQADEYRNGLAYFMNMTQEKEIAAIGIRVVAPGKYFQENKKIDVDYMAKLEEAKEMAPLHIAPALEEIGQIKKWSDAIPLYGISDSAFYSSMPAEAKIYGLPSAISEKYGLYRYGYHGISMQSAVEKIKAMDGDFPARAIICHLGSGSSITALLNGQPIDTSMGFTPLEGLPMGTRVGSIDPGLVLYLAKKMERNIEEVELLLNCQSGLLGISGKTPFVKELIDLAQGGDKQAELALNVYARAVRKYIGAYAALLDGLDLLVFTATIGERSSFMRDKICAGLKYLGNISIVVLPADEMKEMVRQLSVLTT